MKMFVSTRKAKDVPFNESVYIANLSLSLLFILYLKLTDFPLILLSSFSGLIFQFYYHFIRLRL